MGNELLQSNSAITDLSAADIVSALDGFFTFRVQSLSDKATVMGSTAHDKVASDVGASLTDIAHLLESDAQAIRDTGIAFDGLDAEIARNLLGIGE